MSGALHSLVGRGVSSADQDYQENTEPLKPCGLAAPTIWACSTGPSSASGASRAATPSKEDLLAPQPAVIMFPESRFYVFVETGQAEGVYLNPG